MLKDHEPIFGKNVIETLSEGMYDNPLFLYREYVQNSADAIDAAVEAGVLEMDEG
jgi:molecular chaperone HtpG